MEKQKRWQLALIITVFILTLYNILPTIIYYSKPLHDPINATRARGIEKDIATRVNDLEVGSKEWLQSFCDLIKLQPKEIRISQNDPSTIEVEFKEAIQAKTFRKFLPAAGIEIPFVPAQLGITNVQTDDPVVRVARRVGVRLQEQDFPKLFRFSEKINKDDKIAPFYFELTADRFKEMALALSGGTQERALQEALNDKAESIDALQALSEKLILVVDTFGENSTITKRYFKTFALSQEGNVTQRLLNKLDTEKKSFETSKNQIEDAKKKASEKGEFIDSNKLAELEYFTRQIKTFDKAGRIIRDHLSLFQSNIQPLLASELLAFMQKEYSKNDSEEAVYTYTLGERQPLFNQIVIDWTNDSIFLSLHADVQAFQNQNVKNELVNIQQDRLNRWITNEVASVAQVTGENIVAQETDFRVNLYRLADSKSLVALDLSEVASQYAQHTLTEIRNEWKPVHPDFAQDKFPLLSQDEYVTANKGGQRLCLAVFAPAEAKEPISGLRKGSIYVVLRGVQSIIDQYKKFPDSKEAELFTKEFQALAQMMQKRGFIGYMGSSFGLSPELSRDYIFELNDYYSMLLKATREDFNVFGSQRYATLEFTDVEQRILTQNRIDNAIQEDLLKWKESYAQAQVDINPLRHFTVPKPTENAYIANFKLACKKYFRGDDSKILRWGLDLSGGKSVRLALVDHSGKQVTNPEDLKQASNELFTRINKMGVSERTIRIENDTILLDFPGSQGLSAAELVKASAMYFHIVNEQFGPYDKAVAKEVQEFLQDVWNEAVVTNRKDIESINEIAYEKMDMASRIEGAFGSKTPGQILYEKGLRLANPKDSHASPAFDDTLSMIARFQGDDVADWNYQGNPLVIVFHNYALEGASLENVQVGYDPSEGNILSFTVKRSYGKEGQGASSSPRDDFYAWTSQFSKEGITGTPKEAFVSSGRGFRMAVILNGVIISSPSLNASLRDQAMISGHFSQREVSKLATDLRAGSLSFTPRILSEQNVSPELGEEARHKGISASIIGICLVVAVMIGYYHFAGIVASVAVLVNVLIIWAVMQNIDAALTLPGIAGLVLTVGMAVDANVLVFERIREEFKLTGRIASAIQAGYKKAFSAIFDSNITTVLAALILLQFDCGPIRSFAMTLIIGISSSMFTALFMTRYFFAGWVQNPEHRELKMADWIKGGNFDFLKMARPAFIASIILFAAGSYVFVTNWKSMIGMDFTGGYSLVIELENKDLPSIPEKVAHALSAKGLRSQEFQIRELGRSNLLRIQLSIGLEEAGKPFHNLPRERTDGNFTYAYQKNPRIEWVVTALQKEGLQVKPSELNSLANNWTVMSGQFSDAMRNNAILALALALVGVLIYIALRFEWKYGVSAVLALVHDVLLTLAVIAFANVMRLPVQINLEVIGAIMTIIGYSLNDTIIVFDRIREDVKLYRKKSFAEIINAALNQTLSRTLMTSGTTLVVLLALDVFAGSSIFGFSFVMTVGVFLGTLSSLFIAAPILLWLHNKEEERSLALAR
jgi:SecD/SecF fusion protein